MKYQEYKDNVRLENKIIIIISDLEMIGIKINKMDRLLLKESNESDKISDKLLALQRIVQLIEKQEKIMEDEMKINYDKINIEAHRMGISPFLLVKRKYHYRLAKNENKCYNCVNMQHMNFHDGEKVKMQCAFIGESKTDRHADIDYNHTCNAFKKQLTE